MFKKGINFRVCLAVFGGFLVHLALGSFFTFGNFAPYFISYIRNRTEDTTIRNIDGLWMTSVGSLGNCIGFPIGGLLTNRLGPRFATSLGGFIFSASMMACYFCVQQSFVAMVLVFGVTSNIGNFMAYGPPIQNAIRWLPRNPALSAGLIVAGFGGGAIIFNQVITAYINPDNLSPDLITDEGERYFTDAELLDRVPTMFLILGGSYLAMIILGVACLVQPPVKTNEVNILQDEDLQTTKNNGSISSNNGNILTVSEKVFNGTTQHVSEKPGKPESSQFQVELNMKEAIKLAFKTRSFYLVWLIVLTVCCGMQFVFTLYKAYGQTFIENDHFLSMVGSVSSIFNCLGRPFWGAFMDKFGYKATIRCLSVGLAVFAGTLQLTELVPKELFAVWICALFFFFCGMWAVTPSVLAKLYGPKNMALNYGFIVSAAGVGNLTAGITGMALKSRIGWHGLQFISSGLSVIPFFISFLFNGRDRQGKKI
ncbi:uncharacterized protein LOC132728868 isoform X1 [Ruditapes philippinarum]|uniref:uncharacterized protein LOC132728868 isoform X1 n=1 Tax=Ruditapes philippinarum TaxID=129788 RepID=UPI00295B4EE1|nr:uncharacterized protein LOC132728868 isoform X1 [Ruditapes philippinarum]